jgi:hypothetical protein
MKVRQSDNTLNPANTVERVKGDRTRISMSNAELKLAIPEIPGYHLHWMIGTPSRIAQALKAGYTFVEHDEVETVNTDIAGDFTKNGNSDLGSRVSTVAGSDTGEDGKEQRLYLMKLPQEFRDDDERAMLDRSERIASSIRGASDLANNPYGRESRYIPESMASKMNGILSPKR